MGISVTTQMKPEYTCRVPIVFGKDVVGHLYIDPERLRKAVFYNRSASALGPPRQISTEEVPKIVSKLDAANEVAVGTAFTVCEQLKQKHAADSFLEDLAAEFNLMGGELTRERLKYLAQAGPRLLHSTTIKKLIEKRLAAQETLEVRDFLEWLTPGRPGRRTTVDHAARRARLQETIAQLEEHMAKLKKAKNRYEYFQRHMRKTLVGERIVATALDMTWFPRTGERIRIDNFSVERWAAQLMAHEGLGGQHVLRREARELRRRT